MPNETLWSRISQRFNLADVFRRAAEPPLVDRGFGLIYDTERDITWLQDANYAKTVGRSVDGQLTWSEATAWVAALNYRDIRGWRLPRALNSNGSGPCVGYNCNDSELGHIFLSVNQTHPGLVNWHNGTVPCIYWTSTVASTDEAFAFDLFNLRQGALRKNPFGEHFGEAPLSGPVLSWPVHDGDVSAQLRSSFLRSVISAIFSRFRR